MRSRLRHGLIAAQVAVSLTLMIAGGLLVRSAIHALNMDTGYDGEHVVDLTLQFPEESSYTATHKAVLVRDLRSRLAALPGRGGSHQRAGAERQRRPTSRRFTEWRAAVGAESACGALLHVGARQTISRR